MPAMKFFFLFVVMLSLLILTCKDKSVSNEEVEKEFARVFFGDGSYINVEEIVGAVENRITCKQIITGPGILVYVRDYEGREFRLEIDNVTTTGAQFVTSYVHYKDTNGEVYETTSSGLPDTEISWWDNLTICTFKYGKGPAQLYSNSGHILLLDSFSIEALREDD